MTANDSTTQSKFDPQTAQLIDELKRTRRTYQDMQSLVFAANEIADGYQPHTPIPSLISNEIRPLLELASKDLSEAFWAYHQTIDHFTALIDQLTGKPQDREPAINQTENHTGGGLS